MKTLQTIITIIHPLPRTTHQHQVITSLPLFFLSTYKFVLYLARTGGLKGDVSPPTENWDDDFEDDDHTHPHRPPALDFDGHIDDVDDDREGPVAGPSRMIIPSGISLLPAAI